MNVPLSQNKTHVTE